MLLCEQKDSVIFRILLYASGWEEARPSSKTFTQQKHFIKKEKKKVTKWEELMCFISERMYTVCDQKKLQIHAHINIRNMKMAVEGRT